jgi:hypothetical protein
VIIVGEMNLTLKKGSGEFYCPMCSGERPYVRKRIKRFLTVYFIPLIPLSTVSEHVQCQKCRQTFPLTATSLRPEDYQRAAAQQFADDVRRVMVLTMLADHEVQEEEISVIQRVYQQLTGRELTRAELDHDMLQARRSGVSAVTYARAIASRRSAEEKEWLIRGAFHVAAATGELSDRRMEQLKDLPTVLGVEPERFRQIVAESSGG